jgi:uncharacterized protein (DUF3084 family)
MKTTLRQRLNDAENKLLACYTELKTLKKGHKILAEGYKILAEGYTELDAKYHSTLYQKNDALREARQLKLTVMGLEERTAKLEAELAEAALANAYLEICQGSGLEYIEAQQRLIRLLRKE